MVNSQIVSTPGLLYYKPWYMGRQISQYSLCVSVTQFTFYMVSSTFYKVNFFLYGQLFFYMVNFLLFISVSVKGRLQISDCRL